VLRWQALPEGARTPRAWDRRTSSRPSGGPSGSDRRASPPGATARARGAAAQAYAGGQAQLRLADELPPAWRPIVADCLAPDHNRRTAHSAASVLERVQALADGGEPGAAPRAARLALPRGLRARIAAGVLVVAGASTAAALAMTGGSPPLHPATVTVYNAERACQHSTLPTCRLGLVRDPRAAYAAVNVTARVRHGDRLVAECYTPDGTVVMAENRVRSTRWYRVRTGSGTA
jgi:serine/threonine-protein kinase